MDEFSRGIHTEFRALEEMGLRYEAGDLVVWISRLGERTRGVTRIVLEGAVTRGGLRWGVVCIPETHTGIAKEAKRVREGKEGWKLSF